MNVGVEVTVRTDSIVLGWLCGICGNVEVEKGTVGGGRREETKVSEVGHPLF